MTDPDLTPEQIRENVTRLQEQRRKGADQLHARATFTKTKTLTDTESAAIAQAKLDSRGDQS